MGMFSRLTSMGQVTSLEWAPDGSRLLFAGGVEGTVWTQAASGGEAAQLLYQQAALLPQATLSPDGRALLATTLSGENRSLDIIRVDLDSSAVAQDFLDTPADELAPAFSPDGSALAYLAMARPGQDFVLLDASGKKTRFVEHAAERKPRGW